MGGKQTTVRCYSTLFTLLSYDNLTTKNYNYNYRYSESYSCRNRYPHHFHPSQHSPISLSLKP